MITPAKDRMRRTRERRRRGVTRQSSKSRERKRRGFIAVQVEVVEAGCS
jgi:hypothetical protein